MRTMLIALSIAALATPVHGQEVHPVVLRQRGADEAAIRQTTLTYRTALDRLIAFAEEVDTVAFATTRDSLQFTRAHSGYIRDVFGRALEMLVVWDYVKKGDREATRALIGRFEVVPVFWTGR